VTHYMDFHPGGDIELMRGVGQDGTNLFNQVGSGGRKMCQGKTLEKIRNINKILLENRY